MLKINKGTVISALKKSEPIVIVNPAGGEILAQGDRTVRLERAVEMDEQWSFVGRKANPRWLWQAVDHATNSEPGLNA